MKWTIVVRRSGVAALCVGALTAVTIPAAASAVGSSSPAQHAGLASQGPEVGSAASLLQQYKIVPPADLVGSLNGFATHIAISGDGTTALISDPGENGNAGAAWVYVKDGSTWTEQQEFTEPGGRFGLSVALSSDGNTAAVGGGGADVWIFTRTETTWTAQHDSTADGNLSYGAAVSLSGDGDTALVGGGEGAAWVMSRTGTTWSAPTEILDPNAPSNGSDPFGSAVALSGDGDTALIANPAGGTVDAPGGEVYVYTGSGAAFSEKQLIVPTDERSASDANFGQSLALSQDGDTALIGGPADSNDGSDFLGAAWVYTRSGSGDFTEQQKITPGDEVDNGSVGLSVALSSDGETALIGGPGDANEGAVWIYALKGDTWTEQQKTLPNDEIGSFNTFGQGVGLSSDGSVAVIGGHSYPSEDGAVWVFSGSSVSVSFGAIPEIAPGKTVNVPVTVTAGSSDLNSLSLGAGLAVSNGRVRVSEQAAGIDNFSIAAGKSRRFVFQVKGVAAGKASLSVDVSGSGAGGDVSGSATAIVNVAVVRLDVLHVITPTAAVPSDRIDINYRGLGWDPDGGDITMSWSGAHLGGFPQAATFEGKFGIDLWPHRVDDKVLPDHESGDYCYGELAARQGVLVVTEKVSGRWAGWVLWSGNPRIKAHEAWCEGEDETQFEKIPFPLVAFGYFTSPHGSYGLRLYGAGPGTPVTLRLKIDSEVKYSVPKPYDVCVVVKENRKGDISTTTSHGACS